MTWLRTGIWVNLEEGASFLAAFAHAVDAGQARRIKGCV